MTPEEQNKKAQEEIEQILFKDFKKFADQTRIYIARDYFALSLFTGQLRESFVLTPIVAKSLTYWLSKQVEAYENQFGQIPFVIPSIPSPYQGDLKKPDSDQASGSSDSDKKKGSNDKPKKK